MKRSEFEERWTKDNGEQNRLVGTAIGLHRPVSPTEMIRRAQQKDPARYTEMLMCVCGLELMNPYPGSTCGEWLHPRDVEVIANATLVQRLKAAGLTGCEDD